MPISQAKVREGWVQLLGRYSWDWFITMTFRGDYIHPEAADKRWRLWVSMVNRQLYGPRWYKKKQSVQWVRALELQKRGVIHYHALMSHPLNLNLLLLRFSEMENLRTIAGFARIFPPKSIDAVIRYCSKYVIKGGELECSPFLPQHSTGSVGSVHSLISPTQMEQLKRTHTLKRKDGRSRSTAKQGELVEAANQRKRDLDALATLFS